MSATAATTDLAVAAATPANDWLRALATLLVGKLQDDTVFPMIWVMCGAAVIAFLGYILARLAVARQPAAAPAAGDD